jgi:SAM-dependent methyltransferase
MPHWHDLDQFWSDCGPFIFRQQVRAAAPEETSQILALLDLAPASRILDMPCGVGRHSLELARRGFRITGVDRTDEYLKDAAAAARAEGLSIDWVRADMREFQAASPFDAALNVYTSFGYFTDPADDRRVVENFFRSLRPGGRILFEMIDKDLLLQRFRPTDWSEEPDGTLVLHRRTLSPDQSWIDSRWLIIRATDRREIKFGHRLYGRRELTSLLESVGFIIDRVCGLLSGAPQGPDAPRLVVVATRPAR